MRVFSIIFLFFSLTIITFNVIISDTMDIIYFRHNKLSQKIFLLDNSRICYSELTIVIKGELCYLINGERFSVKAGDCLYLKPSMMRQRLDSEKAEYLSFNFHDTRFFDIPTLFHNTLSSEIKMLINVCDEIHLKYIEWSGRIGKVLDLILTLLEDKYASVDDNPIVISIKRFVRENLRNKLTLADIANHVGYSLCHCDTIFKKETGDSIINYLITERIAEAKRLLEEGGSSLKTVADDLGFSDYNYFSRIFKKVTGKTPTEYKALCMKK